MKKQGLNISTDFARTAHSRFGHKPDNSKGGHQRHGSLFNMDDFDENGDMIAQSEMIKLNRPKKSHDNNHRLELDSAMSDLSG